MGDWISAGLGAWLGNRWFGQWFRHHRIAGTYVFVFGTVAAGAILLFLG